MVKTNFNYRFGESVFVIDTPKYFSIVVICCIFVGLMSLSACNQKEEKTIYFELLDSKRTGLNFSNSLESTPQLNVLKYMYFYNGAGIGAGDFNNDGLIDLFFTANQDQNKMFLNTGDLKFKDITKAAGIPSGKHWSTGVSVVDINNDGLLDLYICRVSGFENLTGRNQLLVCKGINEDGIPTYLDRASDYGLDFSGLSTQAVFFDHDLDGDLDMFLLNHSIHQDGNFGPRSGFLGTFNDLSGDRFYRNDNGKFINVTKASGIHSSAIGYGLGIAISDINLDGYPDIYVGNDFHENDYLYINQQDGTFRDELTERLMHTSQFSMGVDIADINNDALPDIISIDMMPEDPYILKRSLGEDAYDIFHLKIRNGYNHQYARNNLQLNRRNGMFSEIGLYSGIYATDWSWAPLWVDFDNDGYKDLFVSNGIPKRLNDIDYVNYISNEQMQQKIREGKMDQKEMQLLDKFPQIKLENKFYRNSGKVIFGDLKSNIHNARKSYSNGAVYADLDNDGDLDIVVTNIDEDALLYENRNDQVNGSSSAQFKLVGPASNKNAIGAKLLAFSNNEIRTHEKFPVRGFQSSMEIPLHIGFSSNSIDSILVVWPDNSYESVKLDSSVEISTLNYEVGLPSFDYNRLKKNPGVKYFVDDITNSTGLIYLHKENPFVEFDRELLIPHAISTEGPALAVADINHDGLDDVFIGASKREPPAVFLQQAMGRFMLINQPALNRDSMYEDVDAVWEDVNNDSHLDLIVASGGNEFYGKDIHLSPRAYLNDGNGNLSKLEGAFKNLYMTASVITPHDFNGDGYADLFIGGRAVPSEYGEIPQSYLMMNDGQGKFKDVTTQKCKELSEAGLVTNAVWYDMNKDGETDLVVSFEWGGIMAYIKEDGKFIPKIITDKKGWWNFILPSDVNNDGHVDLIAGNLGLNSRLKASVDQPVRMYHYDFDGNGKKEQLVTYYLQGKEIPFASKAEIDRQLPMLKKKFLYAEDFANASFSELLGAQNLEKSAILKANYFSNAVLINDGNMNFQVNPLPWKAQLTSYKDAIEVDANGDVYPDFLLIGNFYANNIQMGRNDADFGMLLINDSRGGFNFEALGGKPILGQSRRIKQISINNSPALVIAKNNDSLQVFRFKAPRKI